MATEDEKAVTPPFLGIEGEDHGLNVHGFPLAGRYPGTGRVVRHDKGRQRIHGQDGGRRVVCDYKVFEDERVAGKFGMALKDARDSRARVVVVKVLGDPYRAAAPPRAPGDGIYGGHPGIAQIRVRRQAWARLHDHAAQTRVQKRVQLFREAVRIQVIVPEPLCHRAKRGRRALE